jgi:hypothetical protein
MDKFVERQNIAHYVELLKTETDPVKCTMLEKLLAEVRSGSQIPHDGGKLTLDRPIG